MGGKRAFTLVELLVVLGIIVVLSALVLTSLSAFRSSADRTVALSQMRQIGDAILHYAGDNENSLPGTLSPEQKAIYDPNTQTQLATRIGPYLGVTGDEAQTVKVFLPPAFVRAMAGKDVKDIYPFVLNLTITVEGKLINPFGSMRPSLVPPMKLASLSGGLWGFTDADQANGLVKGKTWAAFTPEKPVHKPKRFAWYFNGSVQALDEADIVVPPPPKGGGGGGGPK